MRWPPASIAARIAPPPPAEMTKAQTTGGTPVSVAILPNGKATGTFRVPSGAFLVVTDVDWQYIHPDGSAGAEGIQILRLFIQNRREPSTCSRAFESTVVLSGLGQGGTSESMTSGFVVAAGSRICPDVIPGPMGPPAGLQHLILRGYLVRL